MKIRATILLIFALLTGSFSQKVYGQERLTVGDTVPDFGDQLALLLSTGETDTINLSDFNGKLLILDFWATWCTTCVNKFSFLDSIQKEYNGDVGILLINSRKNGDDSEEIRSFLDSWKKRKKLNLQLRTVMSDEVFTKAFPNRFIPHYVWIDRFGKVIAITSRKEVTRHNINKVLAGERVCLPLKAE